MLFLFDFSYLASAELSLESATIYCYLLSRTGLNESYRSTLTLLQMANQTFTLRALRRKKEKAHI